MSPARVAAATLRSYTTPATAAARLKLGAVTALARAGLFRFAPGGVTLGGPGTFIDALRAVLGLDFHATSVQLGPPRINRKPVLRLMDRSGAALAFVKLGVNPLTCERVRAETSALRRIQSVPTPGLVVPSVLAAGDWHGLDYLALSPLVTTTDVAGPALRQRAGASLVEAFPSGRSPLAESAWWERTWARLETCDPDVPNVQRLLRAGRLLLERNGAIELSTGACHGDWSPWNTCARQDVVLAWDWERFSTDLPVGWDEIHYRASGSSGGAATALRRLHAHIVTEHGRGTKEEAVFASYLMYRGTNFVAEEHQRAGSPNGPLSAWLLPILEDAVGSTGPA